LASDTPLVWGRGTVASHSELGPHSLPSQPVLVVGGGGLPPPLGFVPMTRRGRAVEGGPGPPSPPPLSFPYKPACGPPGRSEHRTNGCCNLQTTANGRFVVGGFPPLLVTHLYKPVCCLNNNLVPTSNYAYKNRHHKDIMALSTRALQPHWWEGNKKNHPRTAHHVATAVGVKEGMG